MKREWLKEQGIADELIDKIMKEHGIAVQAEQDKTADALGKLGAANQTIGAMQEKAKAFEGVDIDGLRAEIDTQKQNYEAQIAGMKLDAALTSGLAGAKVKNPALVKKALDMDKIKLDGDKLLGLDDQLTALKTSDAYLFEQEEAPPADGADGKPKVDFGKPHSDKAPMEDTFFSAFAKSAGVSTSNEKEK